MRHRYSRLLPALLALLLIAALPLCAHAEELSSEEVYCFTGAEFEAPLSGDFEGVYVSRTPDPAVCCVLLGDRVIRAGDFLPYSALGELVLRPTCNEDAVACLAYQAISDGTLSDECEFTMQIKSSKNEPPAAEDLSLQTYKNIALSGALCACDPEGDGLSYKITNQPRRGSVELKEDGSFVYTPKKNKVGDDSFTYVATDSAGNRSEEATVQIQILQPLDAETFDDMGAEEQFLPVWMRENGLYSGLRLTDKLCFCPENQVTRGAFLVMTMELAGISPEIGLPQAGFADCEDAPDWMQPYLSAALRRGIARGSRSADGLVFRPNEPVTGAEAAAIVCRSFHVQDAMTVAKLEDGLAVPAWAEQPVAALMSAGISLPRKADEPMTVADCAALLYAVSTLRQ